MYGQCPDVLDAASSEQPRTSVHANADCLQRETQSKHDWNACRGRRVVEQ